MMMNVFAVALFGLVVVTSHVDAFSMNPKAPLRTKSSLKMAIVDPNMPGQVAPTGFFDPLGMSKNIDESELRKWREAELKHGRVAMLAALGFLVQESFHPLFGGQVLGAANWHFQETQNLFPAWWIPLVVGIAIFESFSIAKGWESPADTKAAGRAIASIKEGYTPGDLDFDPLGLSPPRGTKAFADAQTKELQNGRLAMLAIAGMVAQELVDGKGILRHIYEARLFTAY